MNADWWILYALGWALVLWVAGWLARRRRSSKSSKAPVSQAAGTPNAQLISSTCTTGWGDWIHGQLWLLPDGLLRIQSGLARTVAQSGPGTAALAGRRGSSRISAEEINDAVRAHPKNLWLPKAQLMGAGLRRGLLTTVLQLKLADGTSKKLLMMRADDSYRQLESQLERWLGPRFTSGWRRRP